MAGWKPIVGKAFTAGEFDAYCKTLTWNAWKPSFVVLHNTAFPDLAMRPLGFQQQHMANMTTDYRDKKKWSAGPHLFVDDHKIWAFTPLTTQGVHSPSWNDVAIGVEMLGQYSKDEFDSGRGLAVRKNAVQAVASLSRALGLSPDTIRLHKEDPRTDHKDCPGKSVSKPAFVAEVKAALAA